MADQKQMKLPNAAEVQSKYTEAKKKFELAFRDFHQNHLLSKVLDKNKSAGTKKTEQLAVDTMIKSALALDEINVGEGTTALLIISIREQLSMRDRVNELEYELCKAIKDLKTLKGPDDGQKK